MKTILLMEIKVVTDFSGWRKFNYINSEVQLWIFKKSSTESRFRAWHVRTDKDIEKFFREIISTQVASITEKNDYSPISQNNESSCLTHSLEKSESLIALLNIVDAPAPENTCNLLKNIIGAAGYIVKFKNSNEVVYAVRKTASTWKPKIKNSMINAMFNNGELSAIPNDTFSFDSFFDFYCFNETVFIKSKRVYESLLSEKKVYQQNFDNLLVDKKFNSIFTDMSPLRSYIGTNSMQLRRITVIQQKAIYNHPDFSKKVQIVNNIRGFGLKFDNNGKIIPCEKTMKTIMQILLDHRLLSEITDTIYDVPDADAI